MWGLKKQGKQRVYPWNFFHFKSITKPKTSPSRENNFDSKRRGSNTDISRRIE